MAKAPPCHFIFLRGPDGLLQLDMLLLSSEEQATVGGRSLAGEHNSGPIKSSVSLKLTA